MNHASLFTGIGGFDLAAQWMGWENIFQVEIDKFCNKVLEKNFSGVTRYGDIKQFDGRQYAGKIDILTGGFPCQPFSVAGKRKGNQDDRFLWDEMLRVISEVQPAWIVAENVGGIITQGGGLVFEQVCYEMEKEGYEVQPFIIPACATNAPHRRDRVWFLANSIHNIDRAERGQIGEENGVQEINREEICARGIIRANRNATNTTIEGLQEWEQSGEISAQEESETGLVNRTADINRNASNTNWQGSQGHRNNGERGGERFAGQSSWEASWIEVATHLCRMDARVSNRVDRIKSLGNAIVPQVAFEIFKAIEKVSYLP